MTIDVWRAAPGAQGNPAAIYLSRGVRDPRIEVLVRGSARSNAELYIPGGGAVRELHIYIYP
jgi:hypothetical protein